MFVARSLIWGICVGLICAVTAVAQPVRLSGPDALPVSPVSRDDARLSRLSNVRPYARPIWMIRYPVVVETREPDVTPLARPPHLVPAARWDFKPGGQTWSRAAMSAIAAHGSVLHDVVPQDIDRWCPAYRSASDLQRRAFWVGMMSALAKHESTYRPEAVGGGNLWFGLLQIYPPTARGYGCRARTGEALKDPADNLSCAVRIMAVTVPRDNAIAIHDGRWRGVAADWGPMTNRSKISEMAAWTREQEYCRPQALMASMRPQARPEITAEQVTFSTMNEG